MKYPESTKGYLHNALDSLKNSNFSRSLYIAILFIEFKKRTFL